MTSYDSSSNKDVFEEIRGRSRVSTTNTDWLRSLLYGASYAEGTLGILSSNYSRSGLTDQGKLFSVIGEELYRLQSSEELLNNDVYVKTARPEFLGSKFGALVGFDWWYQEGKITAEQYRKVIMSLYKAYLSGSTTEVVVTAVKEILDVDIDIRSASEGATGDTALKLANTLYARLFVDRVGMSSLSGFSDVYSLLMALTPAHKIVNLAMVFEDSIFKADCAGVLTYGQQKDGQLPAYRYETAPAFSDGIQRLSAKKVILVVSGSPEPDILSGNLVERKFSGFREDSSNLTIPGWWELKSTSGAETFYLRISSQATFYATVNGETSRLSESEILAMLSNGTSILVDSIQVPNHYVEIAASWFPWENTPQAKEDFLCDFANCWGTWFNESTLKYDSVAEHFFSEMIPNLPVTAYQKQDAEDGTIAALPSQGCRTSDLYRRSAVLMEYEDLRNDCSGSGEKPYGFYFEVPEVPHASDSSTEINIFMSATTAPHSVLNNGYIKLLPVEEVFYDVDCVGHIRYIDPVLPLDTFGELLNPKDIVTRLSGVPVYNGVSEITTDPSFRINYVPLSGSTIFISYSSADSVPTVYVDEFLGRSWVGGLTDSAPGAIDIVASASATPAFNELDSPNVVKTSFRPLFNKTGSALATIFDVKISYLIGSQTVLIEDAVSSVSSLAGTVELNFIPLPGVKYYIDYYHSSAQRYYELIAGDESMLLGETFETTINTQIVAYQKGDRPLEVKKEGTRYVGFDLDGTSVLNSVDAGSLNRNANIQTGKGLVLNEFQVVSSSDFYNDQHAPEKVSQDYFEDSTKRPDLWMNVGTPSFTKTLTDTGLPMANEENDAISWTPSELIPELLRGDAQNFETVTATVATIIDITSTDASCVNRPKIYRVTVAGNKFEFLLDTVEINQNSYSVANYTYAPNINMIDLYPTGNHTPILVGDTLLVKGQASSPIRIGHYSGMETKAYLNDSDIDPTILCEDPSGMKFGLSYNELYFPNRELRTNDYMDYLKWNKGHLIFSGIATISNSLPTNGESFGSYTGDTTRRIIRLTDTTNFSFDDTDTTRPAPLGPNIVGSDIVLVSDSSRYIIEYVITATVNELGVDRTASFVVLSQPISAPGSVFDYEARKIYRGKLITHNGSKSIKAGDTEDWGFVKKGSKLILTGIPIAVSFIRNVNGLRVLSVTGFPPIEAGSTISALDTAGNIGRFELGSAYHTATGFEIAVYPDNRTKLFPSASVTSAEVVAGETFSVEKVISSSIMILSKPVNATSGEYHYILEEDDIEVKVLLSENNRKISIPWSVLFDLPFDSSLVLESHFQDPDPDPYPTTINNPYKTNAVNSSAIRYSNTIDYREDGVNTPGFATDFENLRTKFGYNPAGLPSLNVEAEAMATAILADAQANPYMHQDTSLGEVDLGIQRGDQYVNEASGNLNPVVWDGLSDYDSTNHPDGWIMSPRKGYEEAQFRVRWRNWDQHHTAISFGTIQELLQAGFDDHGERVPVLYWNRGASDYQELVFSGAIVITRELRDRDVAYGSCPPNALIPLTDKWDLGATSLSRYDVYTAVVYQIDPLGGRHVMRITELASVGSDIPRSFYVDHPEFTTGLGTPTHEILEINDELTPGSTSEFFCPSSGNTKDRFRVNIEIVNNGLPSAPDTLSRIQFLTNGVSAYRGEAVSIGIAKDGATHTVSFVCYPDPLGPIFLSIKNLSSGPENIFLIQKISVYPF